MWSRYGHTICYAEFIHRLVFRNWIGALRYKTTCVPVFRQHTAVYIRFSSRNNTEKYKNGCSKYLRWETMEGLENHEQLVRINRDFLHESEVDPPL